MIDKRWTQPSIEQTERGREREREREAGRQLRLSVNHSVDREGKECVFHCAKVSLRQSTPERERKKRLTNRGMNASGFERTIKPDFLL